MNLKKDFIEYIKNEFNFSPEELENFENHLEKPLKKSIRINTNKISVSEFTEKLEKLGWKFEKTFLGKNMIYVDREDTSVSLGYTIFHLNGYFYVQEVSASSSPFYLSEKDSQDFSEYKILDMSASPGGKTTSLSEYFPNSLIIANEIDKSRLKQLFENINRMGSAKVSVTNYDGQFFKYFPETFDKVLLDAPCSGEGTAYKAEEALKFWNLKNVKKIAKLQFKLLESAFITLKTSGELVYSTCTLNKFENEEIVEKLLEKYSSFAEIIPLSEKSDFIRHWPHLQKVGGFFVAKIRKIKTLENLENKTFQNRQNIKKVSSVDEKKIISFFQENFNFELKGKFFTYNDQIYFSSVPLGETWEKFFFYQTGINIGEMQNGEFVPNFFVGTNFGKFSKNIFEVNSSEIHEIMQGKELVNSLENGYYQIIYEKSESGLIFVKDGKMKTIIENKFVRK